VLLERNGPLAFEALSVNLGSFPPKIPGDDQPGAYSAKPIYRLRELRADLEARFTAGAAPPRVVIAGAGATGAELAGNIARLAHSAGAAAEIVVLAGGSRLLAQLPPRAAAAVRRTLQRRGVMFRLESRVTHLEQGRAVLEGGEGIGFEFFVNATGLQPASVLQKFGLPMSDEGALVVNAHLRSPADARIHGGGDCVALEGHPLPRIGVYAVRQGPVLLHNLLASLEGSQPRRFEPQKKYLWIMNLGDGSGLAARGTLWWRGRSSFLLKDWIDRRFLDGHRPDRAWRG
jgi:NADH dehydrogenase FAD-containing subunit